MNKGGCIHPEILHILAQCGHGDKVLIADGNYPLRSKTSEAELIYLGLKSGQPLVTDVLQAILHEVCIENAEVMMPESGIEPEIFSEFRSLLPDVALETHGRNSFYEACQGKAVRLAISTGEHRVYANILLTIAPAE